MQQEYIANFLGIQELSTIDFTEEPDRFVFRVEKNQHLELCSDCFKPITSIHDRRVQDKRPAHKE